MIAYQIIRTLNKNKVGKFPQKNWLRYVIAQHKFLLSNGNGNGGKRLDWRPARPREL